MNHLSDASVILVAYVAEDPAKLSRKDLNGSNDNQNPQWKPKSPQFS